MRLKTISSALVVTTAVLLVACETEDPHGLQKAETFVAEWAPTVEQNLTDRSEGATVQKALESRIKPAAAKQRGEARRQLPPYDVFIDEVYADLEYKPRLVAHGELTDRGKAVWAALQEVDKHALKVEEFDLEEIEAGLEKLAQLKGDSEAGDLSPDDSEKTWATTYVSEQLPSQFPLDESSYPGLTDELLAQKGERLEGVMDRYTELGKKVGDQSAVVEQLLARNFAHYSHRMKHFRVRDVFIHPREDDRYNDPELRSRRPDEAKGSYMGGVIWRRAAAITDEMSDPVEISHRDIRASLRDLLTGDKPKEVVASLEPQQPQYRALIKEYERYRKIVADGGWKEVKRQRNLKKGSKGETVRALKERLKVEGYYTGTVDDTFDDALEDAIRTYQETHQMVAKGKPHLVFWRSLNISAEERAKQIALNIKRWRDSNMRHEHDDIYVFINVPDFTAEVWENQERDMRFGIVVGNNNTVVDDETDEKTKPNRTPVPLAAYIDRVIYNPYWNVTPRIRSEEILPEVKKEVEAEYKALLAKWEAKKNPKPPKLKEPGSPLLKPDGNPTPANPTGAASPPSDTPSPANTAGSDSVSGSTLASTVGKTGIPEIGLDTKPEDVDPLLAKIQNFPYLDEETGEIDVSTTDPDYIPAWYAANNYEVMYPGKSWEYVRMTPGDHNALGYVKVIFPNLYDVYLHDTNAKPLFARKIRAFSHGCMRMSKPLEFAEYLLRREKKFETNKVPTVLENGEYLPIFFDKQIPVYVEYYTVRVDDQGRANFLADIYDYDEKGIVTPTPPPIGDAKEP